MREPCKTLFDKIKLEETLQTGEITMLNMLLALIVGIMMGWGFHAFFIELSKPQTIMPKFTIPKPLMPEANLSSLAPNENKTTLIPKQNNPKENETNTSILNHEKPPETVDYPQKIEALLSKIETASADELETLHPKLLKLSQRYITHLNQENHQEVLIEFLTSQIELDVQSNFYIYQLALNYFKQGRYEETLKLLKEIEYDYDYEGKVKELRQKIEEKLSKKNLYSYELPLRKIGEHFSLTVQINSMDFVLLLDTGASLTLIDDVKLPSLTTIQENVSMNTAGGEIMASIKQAESFQVGSLELRDFHIVSSAFEHEHYDGLLGMNFFKKFHFKIDQNNSLLLLSPKKEKR